MDEIKNCKIGLIAFPIYYPKEYRVILGQLTDKKTHGDRELLYKIHKKLQYFYPFTVTITKGDITLTTSEGDFLNGFTREITMDKKPPYSEVIEYSPPKLYDLTCMVQLFDDEPRLPMSLNHKSVDHTVFILLLSADPFVRGNIIENCLEIIGEGVNGKNGYFYIMEKEHDVQLLDGGRTKKYLISRGVSEDNINTEYTNDKPVTLESLIITAISLGPDDIYIAAPSNSVSGIRKAICYARNGNRIPDSKFKFVCD